MQLYNRRGNTYNVELMQKQTRKLVNGLRKGLPTAAEYNAPDYLAATLMEANIHRFGFDKNIATIYQLNKALSIDEGFDTFKQKAQGILGLYNKAYLETEYNTAVSTAQNAANYNRHKAQAELFPFMVYQTVGDERVRLAHSLLDGKVFRFDDPAAQAIYPPNGHGCRCEMLMMSADDIADMELISGTEGIGLLGEEYERMLKTGFAVNRGETKQVFDLAKSYLNQLPGTERINIGTLTFASAGLTPYTAFSNTIATALKLPNKNLRDVWQHWSADSVVNGVKYKLYTDYSKRPVGVSDSVLRSQMGLEMVTEEQARHQVFFKLQTLLKNPDEVYLSEGNQYTYIKMYNNSALVAKSRIKPDGLIEVIEWQKANNPDAFRVGLLVRM